MSEHLDRSHRLAAAILHDPAAADDAVHDSAIPGATMVRPDDPRLDAASSGHQHRPEGTHG